MTPHWSWNNYYNYPSSDCQFYAYGYYFSDRSDDSKNGFRNLYRVRRRTCCTYNNRHSHSTCRYDTPITDTVSTATTTTASVTSSVAGPPQSPALCGNAGLQFGFYANPFYNSDPGYYSNYDPTYLKATVPEYTGTTTNVGGTQGIPISIYGSPLTDPGFLTINHRGYLYASQSGAYTFSSTAADEITDLWIGPLTYAVWNGPNALQENVNNIGIPVSTTQVLVAGVYYPLRIAWMNAQGDAAFGYLITAPDGSTGAE
jgi:hypothetical protein